MPKIDFSVPMTNIWGVQLTENEKDPDDPTKVVERKLTLRDIAIGGLLKPEQGVAYKEKLRRYALAERVRDSDGPVELTVKECALIQRRIDKAQPSPLIVGQAGPLLEGNPEPESESKKDKKGKGKK